MTARAPVRGAVKIRTDIWLQDEWRVLSSHAQHLYFLLACLPRTCVECSHPVSPALWASLSGQTKPADAFLSLAELEANGFVSVDNGMVTLLYEEFVVPPRPTVSVSWAKRQRRRMTPARRRAVFDRDGRVCRACGATETLHIDHIIPIARGGSSDLENLQVLCASCNSSKYTADWESWLTTRQEVVG